MISPLRPVTVAFSIHASAKEATRKKMYTPALFLFQSTPPRRRRHTFADTVPSLEYFSIHASAKEARSLNTCRSATCMFSIHASAKEASSTVYWPDRLPIFNPRLREGGDATYCNTPAIMCISSLNNFFVHHF